MQHVAAEQQALRSALEAEVGVGRGAEAVQADAHDVAGGGEVGVEAVVVGEEAADLELAAAGGGGEAFDVEAILVEDERAVQVGQAVGDAVHGEVDVVELDLAGERGLLRARRRLPTWKSTLPLEMMSGSRVCDDAPC